MGRQMEILGEWMEIMAENMRIMAGALRIVAEILAVIDRLMKKVNSTYLDLIKVIIKNNCLDKSCLLIATFIKASI